MEHVRNYLPLCCKQNFEWAPYLAGAGATALLHTVASPELALAPILSLFFTENYSNALQKDPEGKPLDAFTIFEDNLRPIAFAFMLTNPLSVEAKIQRFVINAFAFSGLLLNSTSLAAHYPKVTPPQSILTVASVINGIMTGFLFANTLSCIIPDCSAETYLKAGTALTISGLGMMAYQDFFPKKSEGADLSSKSMNMLTAIGVA